uniref:Integrase catalytic domain-containing protein n=1 Tax=Fagus sylvatica TaxID=28930 RepID=A0A2N9E8D5_FAGSY
MGETHAQGGGQMHGEENPFIGGQAHGGEQVLGGGEIPVGGPQQMALMIHQNKNDNRNHEERESHNKNDTPFVTMSDVADLLKQERERPPKEPRHFVRRPPYPIELLKEPYPEKYDTPVFALFDGRKGSAMEHISKFLDSMGPFAAHGDLCLREFSKSLVDRAYTWYTVLPAGSIRTWEDMVESFCSKYFHVEEKITLVNLHSTKQQIGEDLVKYIHRFPRRVLGLSCEVSRGRASRVKPQVEKEQGQEESTADSHCVHRNRTQRSSDQASKDQQATHCQKNRKDPKYCRYHRYVNHPTVDCRTLRWEVNRKIQNGTLLLSEEQQKVHQTPFPNYNKGKGKAVVSVVIHGNVSDMEAEESAAASSSLVPAAVRTLQKSPKFKSLFNQLGFGPEARNAATEALITIAAESGATCFTAEAHASRAFLETTNAITFTDEDMEVQYPDHRRPLYLSAVIKDVQVRRALVDTGSCLNLIPIKHSSSCQSATARRSKARPMEVTGFGGVTEYTMGHVQLVLKVGPIVALTRFHVVNAETPYHVLLGRPWLHKHKLVSSTYHQCVKGRLNGKPIRIAANSCPFDQTEAHFVEAALYDDLSIHGRTIHRETMWNTTSLHGKILKMILKLIYGSCFNERRKGKEREVEQGSAPQCQEGPTPEEGGLQPSCHLIQQTKNFGKVVVDQLQPTAMSSEGVTVDHAQSMVMNPLEVAVDQTRRGCGGPDRAYRQGKEKESTTAEPNLTSKEELEMPGIDPGLVAHSLNVEPGTRPVVQPMRTFHTEVEAQITQEVKKLLAAGFIKPIQHPRWLSNIVPVKKKNGQIRCCVDFRNLNKACPKDEFPLPNMDLLIDSAAGHAMFSFMDGFSGYNQIRMSTRDAEKTAFRTPIGNFYYTVMPFGLKNAGATYQRTMTAMFHDMMHKEIEDYVDDIVVKSKKREDHLRILRKGRLSYIRRFIPGLAAVTATFMPLMKKGVPFVWSTACQQAFEKIQLIMTKLPTVCAPVPGRPLRLYLASNSEAIGGLVAQEDEDGTEKPIYYVSRALRDAETRYSGAERASIKSQAIADLLAQFPGEDSSSISHEVPGEIGEALLADLADSTWTLKFDGSSTSSSKYEAYITGLVIAHEMGIKHLRVIGDSNLIICQTKGEFSLKEPSLALYRALAQKLEEKFDTFEISHAMRCENRYADALATLGSQVSFEGSKVDVTIDKRSMPITDLLREKFKEQNLDAEDWRTPIRAKLMSPEGVADLKMLKDYVLIAGDLYRRLPGGVLARCVNLQEAAKKLTEVHERCCELRDGVSLYRRLQRLGYFWPSMSKEAASLQEQCSFCQHQHESDQIYATFVSSDWRTPFLEYFIEKCPTADQPSSNQTQEISHKPIPESVENIKARKDYIQLLLTLGYYWPTMKKDTADFVKSCHTCQLQANLIHTHPTSLQNMATPWPFHTWGLDLIGPINPSSGGYIWILVATEYFSKWVEAVPLRKATGAAVANFIREHIITRFGIPHKIISDNGTLLLLTKMLEKFWSIIESSTADLRLIILKAMDKAEATNRMLLRILSKMVFDYGKGWSSHLADTLWAYRGSTKTATGFTPFSLVYGTDAISPTELLVPSLRILHGMDLEADADICAEARVADLEGLEEARELAQVRSLRYHQKLADAYEKTLQTRIFAKGQMVLKTVDHVRRGLPSPSKFAPNWEGPYLIREAYDSGYYKLSTADGTTLVDPINGKWLKRYYS